MARLGNCTRGPLQASAEYDIARPPIKKSPFEWQGVQHFLIVVSCPSDSSYIETTVSKRREYNQLLSMNSTVHVILHVRISPALVECNVLVHQTGAPGLVTGALKGLVTRYTVRHFVHSAIRIPLTVTVVQSLLPHGHTGWDLDLSIVLLITRSVPASP